MPANPAPKGTGKYFGYIEPEADGKSYCIKMDSREMSQENLDEFDQITKVVFDLQPVLFAYEINRRNYSELGEELKRCASRMSPAENIAQRLHSGPDIELYLGPAQKIGNFLASAYAFLSNAEQDLISRFGDPSEQLTVWNDYRRKRHLNSFAYRLLYNLRNFAQHHALPLNGVNAKVDHLIDGQDPTTAFDIYIDRDALINARGDYLKNNKADLATMAPRFSISPLIHEYFSEIRWICKEFIELDLYRLKLCQDYLQTLAKVFTWPDGCLPVIFNGKPQKKDLQSRSDFDFELMANTAIIPVKQFGYIRDLYNVVSVKG